MNDLRIEKLAALLVNHSCSLREGERVFIEAINAPVEIVTALIREAKAIGATPIVGLKDDRVISELCRSYTESDVKIMAELELNTLKQVDAFISIRAIQNPLEYANIPDAKLKSILTHYIEPVHYQYRNENLRWVALRWPTAVLAEQAQMTNEEFEDFFFKVSLVDYARMEEAMAPLASLMSNTNEVRIAGPGTDLSFSIKGIPPYASVGKHNIPDGEIFTAPVKDTVEGQIRFNVSSVYYGTLFDDVSLEFQGGKVVNAASRDDSQRLNEVLDQDEGARFVGEFAFGVHPEINRPIRDILFDEKMAGSVHIALGNAYPQCNNGNKSAIHWDLILMQTQAEGGGSVYFDGQLIRKDGVFVLPELAPLNPENLR